MMLESLIFKLEIQEWNLGVKGVEYQEISSIIAISESDVDAALGEVTVRGEQSFPHQIFLKNRFIYSFIYFWLCWVFVAARRLSLAAASRGYSSLWCTGFSLRWLLLLRSMGSRRMGFSRCGTQAQQLWLAGSRGQAQQLWRTGLVAPRHVGSSRSRAQTCVPCVGRRILNHCTTRGVLPYQILITVRC